MDLSNSLTTTSILAAASRAFEQNGYARADEVEGQWPSSMVRLFEDSYGIVAVVVFETWDHLSSGWMEAQASMIELISKHLTRTEAKAWEGYLVLLTPNPRPVEAAEEFARIDRDTSRVRKIVATGDELMGLGDVEIVLLPLLPLSTEKALVADRESILDSLPRLLSRKGIDKKDVEIVVKAFLENEPLVESLHLQRTNS